MRLKKQQNKTKNKKLLPSELRSQKKKKKKKITAEKKKKINLTPTSITPWKSNGAPLTIEKSFMAAQEVIYYTKFKFLNLA